MTVKQPLFLSSLAFVVAALFGLVSRRAEPGIVEDDVFLMQTSSATIARPGMPPNPLNQNDAGTMMAHTETAQDDDGAESQAALLDDPISSKTVSVGLTQAETAQDNGGVESRSVLLDDPPSPTVTVSVNAATGWTKQELTDVLDTVQGVGGLRSPRLFRNPWFWSTVLLAILLVVVFSIPLVDGLLSRWLEKILSRGCKSFGKRVLGLNVEVDTISVTFLQGRLSIEKVVVRNPNGHGFEADYLLQVRKVTADFSVWSLLWSRGTSVRAEALVFKDVEVTFEKNWSFSNLDRALDLMGMGSVISPGSVQLAGLDSATIHGSPNDVAKPLEEPSEKSLPSRVDMKILRVGVLNIGARLHTNARVPGSHGAQRHAIADFVYSDFSTEVGHSRVEDIVRGLMKTLLAKVILDRKAKLVAQRI